AVVLGLLCLLLLTGLMTSVCLCEYFCLFICLFMCQTVTKGNSEWETEMVQLQTSYTNLTRESDQLQTSYTNLTRERDQLQTSYTNLTRERDQLQTSNTNLINALDMLQKRVEELAKKRNDLQGKIRGNCLFLNFIVRINNLNLTYCYLSNPNQYTKQGWLYFSGSVYYISSLKKSWLESREDCVQRSADLVIISSEEEQNFVRNFLKHMWIGLTDRETEGRWKWVDGTPLTKSFWMPLEPNRHQLLRDEDCAEMSNYYLENSWNDDQCEHKKMWTCEKILPL
uniref:C-type lectin domain-containing protein n=1 Tax=Cyclopterus lumpus TaxID=8103 RepID=A0A8C3B6C9_CYCLU